MKVVPRKQVIEQIIWHIEHEEYIYYGNKEQFRKRKEEALKWLRSLTHPCKDESERI